MTGGVLSTYGEYPLWALLRDSGRVYRLEYIKVNNVSERLYKKPQFRDFTPCFIIIIKKF